MNDETRCEVIKALAYDGDIEEIANMAEITAEEVEVFAVENAAEIEERRRAAEAFGL